MEKVAGLYIEVKAKEAADAALALDRLVTASEAAEKSLRNLKDLARETAPTIDALGKVVTGTQQSLSSMEDVLRIIKTATDQANRSAKSLSKSVDSLNESTSKTSLSVVSMGNSMGTAAQTTAEAAKSADELAETTKQVTASTEEAKAQRDRLTVGLKQSTNAAKENAVENQKLERRVGSLNKELARKENYLVRIAKRAFVAAAGVYALNKAVQLARYGFEVARDMETLNTQLELITGSAYGAAEAISFLQGESERLGLNFREASKQFGAMVFSFREVGLSADVAKDLFTGVGSAAATFGMSQADVNGIMDAFVRMANKGVVSSQELSNQIGSRLPGAFSAAARAMGTNTVQLSRLMAQGKILAEDLIPALAGELNKVWGADAERQADTLIGAVNRLQTAWDKLFTTVQDTEFIKDSLKAVTFLVNLLNDSLTDSRSREELEARKESVEKLLGAFTKGIGVFAVSGKQVEALRKELVGIEVQLLRLAEVDKQQEAAAVAEAKTREEIARTTASKIAGTYTEMYTRIQHSRETDLEREVRMSNALAEEKSNAIKKINSRLQELEELGLNEEFDSLLEILKEIERVDPFASLAQNIDRSFSGLMAKTKDEYTVLNEQLAADLETLENLRVASAKAGSEMTVEEFVKAHNAIWKHYEELVAKLGEKDFDFTGLRRAAEKAAGELGAAFGSVDRSLGSLESGKEGGGNLFLNMLGMTGAVESMRGEFDRLKSEYETGRDGILGMQAKEGQSEVELQKEKYEQLTALAVRYNENLKAVEGKTNEDRAKAFGTFQDDILYLAQSGSKTMGRIAKGVAIANTIMGTYESAQNAFKALSGLGPMGPALGAAAAAAAIAAGMARVQAIRSTNYAGEYDRGGMIPSGSVGMVGERGPELVRGPAMVTSTRTTADRGSGSGSRVSVVINNHSGGKASVREEQGPDGERVFKVLVERVERELAGKVATGGSSFTRSLEGAYALRRGTT